MGVLTPEERWAVEEYFRAGGKITKVPTGVSGLYDENGIPRSGIGSGTRQTIARFQEMQKSGLTWAEMASQLGVSAPMLKSLVNRWSGWSQSSAGR